MLCKNCRRQVSRTDEVCGVCGAPLPGRAPLELVLGDGRRIPLVGQLTLGRGSDNLIRIDGDTVSRRHARIVVDGGFPALEDAGSTYGTFVDGQKIAGRTALHDGAEIRLGDAEMHVMAKRSATSSGKTVVFGNVTGLDGSRAVPPPPARGYPAEAPRGRGG